MNYTVGYEEKGRLHSDTETTDSKTASYDQKLKFDLDFEENFKFDYTEQQEDWHLFHSDKTEYVRLIYRYHKPSLVYHAEPFDIDFSVPVLDVTRREPLYSRIEGDESDRFIMPSVIGSLGISDFFLKIGAWKENDFQPFNYLRYSIVIFDVLYGNIGYRLTESHEISAGIQKYKRVYPENFDLEKYDINLFYRFFEPLSFKSDFEWRELSFEYKETHYTSSIQKEFELLNHLKFKMFELTHFISLGLTLSDSYTTYREGLFDYSLIEEEQKEDDLALNIEYAGFTRISSSRFFISWKYKYDDSLTRDAYTNHAINLALTYAF